MHRFTKQEMTDAISDRLRRNFGRDLDEADEKQVFKAAALVLRDIMSDRRLETERKNEAAQAREVHYLSLEFLLGRSLKKNAYNLGVLEPLTAALDDLELGADAVFETEPDAGLGNGGLGRLAACYLDSLTTLEVPAVGYSICYELGIFRQRIVDGGQVELADNWLELGDAWLITRVDEAEEVRFGGTVSGRWENGRYRVSRTGGTTVLAIPRDMEIAGYGTGHVNLLRLWDAKSPQPADMSLYSRGEYLKAVEQQAMAEVIAKVLYPDDNHYEGKSLRLKQQYFFVSATVQSIVRRHRAQYGTLRNFAEKHVIQINDTHPALVIPELMRILLDEEGYSWDEAWGIVTKTVAYTNHTVLSEALERWPQALIEQLLPRTWMLLCEINSRYLADLRAAFGADEGKLREMAIVWGGEVRMANLCVCACFRVNGVSALHADILRRDVFRDACRRTPEKFLGITNGVDHRRFLSQSNPRLDAFIRALTGGGDYLLRPAEALPLLERYRDDAAVLSRLGEIKAKNKADFAAWLQRERGVVLNTDAMFDVQVKRLHEYKRQLLNAMHIAWRYLLLKDGANTDATPRVFLFGAKAAPGYQTAKRIIRLLVALAAKIDADPACQDRLQMVFLENYRVSLAERLIPASELSEQISTAGKEASGTGNMKFMMNGALTIGTLDGANVEMHDAVGDENMFLFGLTAPEAEALRREGYNPYAYYGRSEPLRRVLTFLSDGLGESFGDLTARLLFGCGGAADEYLLLADFDAYCRAQERAGARYRDQRAWNRSALLNIARSGVFAADRAVSEYAEKVWNVPHRR